MLEKLFPKERLDHYNGYPFAKWIFILLTIITLGRSLIHIFAPDGGAHSIATIPLDTFTQNGTATVILIFSLWGLSQLLIGFIYLVVIWRYQALIPFMYLLMIVEYGMRIFLFALKPAQTIETAPGSVGNFIILPLAIIMLFFSLQVGNNK